MYDWLIPLSAVTEDLGGRVGGKAGPLALLLRDGIGVPAGFVVTGAALERWVAEAGLAATAASALDGDEQASAVLEAWLLSNEAPPWIAGPVAAAASDVGLSLAVRSSAADEDGRSRSFAGQHHTALDVPPAGVEAALRACWASAWATRSLAYRGGKAPRPRDLAVLVQRMVPARAAGVLFTINPVTGSWREMTVEAVPGLGVGVVDGTVTPHWYLVRRPRSTPRPVQRVLARVRLQVVQEDGPRHEAGVRLLSHHDVRRLCRLGLRIEARLGGPQDIEWAIDGQGRLWVLQARPVTAGADPRARADVLWTRRFLGERFPDPVTPLAWSLIDGLLAHFIAYPEVQARYLGGGPPTRLVSHRPYLNVSVFLHLAFKLPGSPPPRFIIELLPPEEAESFRRRFAVLPDLAVYRAILRTTWNEERWRRFAWNPWTNPDVWDTFEAGLVRDLPQLQRPVVSATDGVRRAEDLLDVLREYIGIHVCSLLFANLCDQLVEGGLATWMPERSAELTRALLVSLPDNRTLEVNRALVHLARRATRADLEALAAGAPLSADFRARLDEFLALYGHRSHASWDVMAPRWRDEPARLVPLLRASADSTDADDSAGREQRFTQAFAEVEREIGGTPRGVVLLGAVRLARRYLSLRENQRFRFEQVQMALQDVLRDLGVRLAGSGWIGSPDDVRFLSWDEVRAAALGELGAEIAGFLPKRRAAWEAAWSLDPPQFLRGEEAIPVPEGASRLEGHGVSAGRVTGRVVRARTLADAARLRPGDVLVVPAVDPGWTPLLRTAGGLVLEMGGRLSHGAVVAREYGVPAVVNVEGALARLRDGQEVTVDGTRGIVYVHG